MLGFGFIFRAIDDGLKAALTALPRAFGAVQDAASSAGNTMREAMSIVSLRNIQGMLEELTGGNIQLMNSLENEFFELGKTARPILGGIGLRGEELGKAMGKATSLAHKFQMGVDGVAKTMVELERSSDEVTAVLDKMGLSLEELVKFERVTQQSGAELVSTIQALATSYGFSTEQVEDFLNTFTEVAQASSTAQQGFAALGKDLDMIDDAFAEIGSQIKDQPAEVRKYLLETQKLAGVFKIFTGSIEKAGETSSAFTKFLLEGRKALIKAQKVGGELPPEFVDIATAIGDADAALRLFSLGPEEALKELIKLRKGLDGAMAMKFDEAIKGVDSSLSFAAQGGARAEEALAKLNKTIAGTTGGLKGLTKAAQPAIRSLDEQMELMSQRFDSRLHKLSGGSRGFIKAEQRTFNAALKQIERLTNDPVWGMWVKRLVNARRLGMFAFFRPVKMSAKELEGDLKGLSDAMDRGGLYGRLEAIKRLGPAGFFIDLNKALTGKEGFNKALEDANKRIEGFYVNMKATKAVLGAIAPGLGALAAAFGSLFVVSRVLAPVMGFFRLIVGSKIVVGVLGAIGSALGGMSVGMAALASALAVGAGLVAGLAALFVLPEKYGDTFAGFLDGLVPSIEDFTRAIDHMDAGEISDRIVDFLHEVIDTAADAADTIFTGFFDLGAYLIEGTEPPGKNSKLIKSIGKFMSAVGKAFVSFATQTGYVIQNVMTRVLKEAMYKAHDLMNEASANFMRDLEAFGIDDFVLKMDGAFQRLKAAMTFEVDFIKKSLMRALVLGIYVPFLRFTALSATLGVKLMKALFVTPMESAVQAIGEMFDDLLKLAGNTIAKLPGGEQILGILEGGAALKGFKFTGMEDMLKKSERGIQKLRDEADRAEREVKAGRLDDFAKDLESKASLDATKASTSATVALTDAVLILTATLQRPGGGTAASSASLTPPNPIQSLA